MTARPWVHWLTWLAIMTACSSAATRPQTTVAPVTTTEAGGSVGTQASPASTATTFPPGQVVLTLVDGRGNPQPGLTVRLSGTRALSVVSDASGHVQTAVPAGSYTAAVLAGCVGEVFIQRQAQAHLDVPPATTVRGTIEVAAVNRTQIVGPTHYVRVDPPVPAGQEGTDATMHVGQRYLVSFSTHDRCTGGPRADASLATLRFIPAAGYALAVPFASSTDASGHGAIGFRCTTPNDQPGLIVEAIRDDRDQVDLFNFDLIDRPVPMCSA